MQVFSYFVLYPFAGDEGNEMSLGLFVYKLRPYLHEAFACNVVGHISMWVGKYIYDHGNRVVKFCKFDSMVNSTLFCGNCFSFFVALYMPFIFVVLWLEVKYSGDELLIIMRTGLFQTITNIVTCGIGVIIAVLIIKFIQFRGKKYLFLSLVFLSICFFMGRRSLLLSPLAGILLMYFVYKGRRLKISYVILLVVFTINFVFVLDDFRHERTSNSYSVVDKIKYGNSFSDARDFAFVLSGRNDEYLYGKTYLAGLMSFIPSSFSDFRTEWAIGHVSLKMAGVYEGGWTEHGGLRGGSFMESYLNFGYLGIILISIIYGYIMEWISVQHKYYSKRKFFSAAYSCGVKLMFISVFVNSANAWQLFGLIIPIIFIYKIVSVKINHGV